MRIWSFEQFDVSPRRMIPLGAAAASVLTVAAWQVLGGVLQGATAPALAVIWALVFYVVLSTPRRALDGERVAQAKESVLLSAAATACLKVTGSGPRTVLLLRSRDPVISKVLRETGRCVLLGWRVSDAVASSSGRLTSYSAAAALRGVAAHGARDFDPGDEEMKGLASSSELSRETKLPVFMTACFFTPIMLLLYAVFSHTYAAQSLVELTALEFIVLDLAFYLSSGDRLQR